MSIEVVGGQTRSCPQGCRDTLRVVEGSKGRMSRCRTCGWTGPTKRKQEEGDPR